MGFPAGRRVITPWEEPAPDTPAARNRKAAGKPGRGGSEGRGGKNGIKGFQARCLNVFEQSDRERKIFRSFCLEKHKNKLTKL